MHIQQAQVHAWASGRLLTQGSTASQGGAAVIAVVAVDPSDRCMCPKSAPPSDADASRLTETSSHSHTRVTASLQSTAVFTTGLLMNGVCSTATRWLFPLRSSRCQDSTHAKDVAIDDRGKTFSQRADHELKTKTCCRCRCMLAKACHGCHAEG